MATHLPAILSAALLLLPACQLGPRCEDQRLTAAVAEVEAIHRAHPMAIGEPQADVPAYGRGAATRGVLDACPGFPTLVTAPDDMRITDFAAELENLKAALKDACLPLSLMETERLDSEDSHAFVADSYRFCRFDRFELVEPLHFDVSDDGLSAVMTYDSLVRMGADEGRARVLSRELLWQSPWPLDDEWVARIPVVSGLSESAQGIGVRLTRAGVTLMPDTAAIPYASMGDIGAALQSHLSTWRDGGARVDVLVVADADVPSEAVIAVAGQARARGAARVLALATAARSDFGQVSIERVDLGDDRPAASPRGACIDPEGAWLVDDLGTWMPVAAARTGEPSGRAEILYIAVMGGTPLQAMLTGLAALDRGPGDSGGNQRLSKYVPGHDRCREWFARAR